MKRHKKALKMSLTSISGQSNMEAQDLSSNFPCWYEVYQTISLCWHKVYQPNFLVGTRSIRQPPLLTQDLWGNSPFWHRIYQVNLLLTQDLSGNFPSWIKLQKKSRRSSVLWLELLPAVKSSAPISGKTSFLYRSHNPPAKGMEKIFPKIFWSFVYKVWEDYVLICSKLICLSYIIN